MNSIITLTTDFGIQDEFVGVMKGVILSICPKATVIDISHDIRPQDIRHAQIILQSSCCYFPKKSIHVAVVDPGVGTARRIIALKQNNRLFLGPDNGILSPFLEGNCIVYQVTNTNFFLDSVSATFHGRDIFAPVAAHLGNGVSLDELGPSVNVNQLVKCSLPTAFITEKYIAGVVIDIDRFGNLITNITKHNLETFNRDSHASLIISLNGIEVVGIDTTFGNTLTGLPVVLFGSRGLLEIAVNQGSASQFFNAHIGNKVSLTNRS